MPPKRKTNNGETAKAVDNAEAGSTNNGVSDQHGNASGLSPTLNQPALVSPNSARKSSTSHREVSRRSKYARTNSEDKATDSVKGSTATEAEETVAVATQPSSFQPEPLLIVKVPRKKTAPVVETVTNEDEEEEDEPQNGDTKLPPSSFHGTAVEGHPQPTINAGGGLAVNIPANSQPQLPVPQAQPFQPYIPGLGHGIPFQIQGSNLLVPNMPGLSVPSVAQGFHQQVLQQVPVNPYAKPKTNMDGGQRAIVSMRKQQWATKHQVHALAEAISGVTGAQMHLQVVGTHKGGMILLLITGADGTAGFCWPLKTAWESGNYVNIFQSLRLDDMLFRRDPNDPLGYKQDPAKGTSTFHPKYFMFVIYCSNPAHNTPQNRDMVARNFVAWHNSPAFQKHGYGNNPGKRTMKNWMEFVGDITPAGDLSNAPMPSEYLTVGDIMDHIGETHSHTDGTRPTDVELVNNDEIMDKYFTPDVKAIAKKVYAEGAFAQGFTLLELPEF